MSVALRIACDEGERDADLHAGKHGL